MVNRVLVVQTVFLLLWVVSRGKGAQAYLAYVTPGSLFDPEGLVMLRDAALIKAAVLPAAALVLSVLGCRAFTRRDLPLYAQCVSMDDDVFSRHDQVSDDLVVGGGEAGQTLQQRVLWLQNVFKTGEMPGISLEKLAGNLAYLVSACLPLAGRKAAKELLLRCFRQLPAARQRADRLGMPGALFPSWKDAESGSDSRHWDICGNASVAQAVFDYVAYTADFTFLRREGLDLLVGIAQNAKAYLDNHGGDHNDLVATAGWCGRLASQAVGLAGAQRLSELGLIGGGTGSIPWYR